MKKFSASGLWGITVAKEYGGAFVSNATLTKVGLTQKTSQTLIPPFGFAVAYGGKPSYSAVSPCRASCFSQGETLREQVS
ncbi:hypothetical protein [Nostoc sp.]|uniref:hypothetical protein n=1 Tax=Nostoc sp. TaxID=1180 RepID=UPI002FF744C0